MASEVGTARRTLRESRDDDLALGPDLYLQFVAVQESHADQWGSVGLIDENPAWLAIPFHVRLVHINKTFATIGQRATINTLP